MAENQGIIQAQVDDVRDEIDSERRARRLLGNGEQVSREQLLTYDMIERYPLITDQTAYTFRWHKVDGLYQFIDRLPAWIVDDDIMKQWSTGDEEAPQAFKSWQTKKVEFGQALLLSWAPARLSGVVTTSETEKVFSAVVVCIHPDQSVMTIKDGAHDIYNLARDKPERAVSALCRLPKVSANTFYPSPLNDSFLVLPYYTALDDTKKKVHLESAVALNKHMVVRRLHRRRVAGGDEAVLPPVFSKDPGIPGTLPVGYLSTLWANTKHITVVPEGGTGLFQPTGKGVRPAISLVLFCGDEMEAQRSLARLQGEDVVYAEESQAAKDSGQAFLPFEG